MNGIFQIEIPISQTGFWRILFATSGGLGIYLSIIQFMRDKFRRKRRTLLGLLLLSLAVPLIYISNGDLLQGWSNEILRLTAIFLLFLLGPSSHGLYKSGLNRDHRGFGLIHLLTGTVILVGLVAGLLIDQTVFLLAAIHAGLYLLFQLHMLFLKNRNASNPVLHGYIHWGCWFSRFVMIQLLLFICIVASSFWMEGPSLHFFICVCLTILIMVIWVRLIYTAYLSYIISTS